MRLHLPLTFPRTFPREEFLRPISWDAPRAVRTVAWDRAREVGISPRPALRMFGTNPQLGMGRGKLGSSGSATAARAWTSWTAGSAAGRIPTWEGASSPRPADVAGAAGYPPHDDAPCASSHARNRTDYSDDEGRETLREQATSSAAALSEPRAQI